MLFKPLLALSVFVMGVASAADNNTIPEGRIGAGWPVYEPRAEPLCSTNGECLKKHLPLLRPRQPSQARALRPRASPGPIAQYSGRLALATASAPNTIVGYLDKRFTGSYASYNTFTTDPANILEVSGFINEGSDPFSIVISPSTRQAGYPYLAFVAAYGDPGPTPAGGYAFMTASQNNVAAGVKVSRADNPNPFGSSGDGVENTVLSYDQDTGRINFVWRDANNDPVPCVLFSYLSSAAFMITGNLAGFQTRYGSNSVEYVMYLERT